MNTLKRTLRTRTFALTLVTIGLLMVIGAAITTLTGLLALPVALLITGLLGVIVGGVLTVIATKRTAAAAAAAAVVSE